MPGKNTIILTLLSMEGKENTIEIDPANIVMGKVTDKDLNIYFNFKYRHEGKLYPLKVHLPILPARMYEKYNDKYDTVTRKATVRLVREDLGDEDFDAIVAKIFAIQDRMDEIFIKAMEKQLKTNKSLSKAAKVTKVPDELKKLDDFLFYYEDDKDGNPIENAEDRQFLSVKIEPNRDWLAPKVNLLGQASDQPIPTTLKYTNPNTGETTEYKNLMPSELEWFHLLDVRTLSSCTVNFDSFMVRKDGKNLIFRRRVFLAVNSIADFVESQNDDGAAEAAQDLFGDNEKVNTNINEKFSAFSKFLPGGEDESGGILGESGVVIGEDSQEEKDDESVEEESESESGEEEEIMPPVRRRGKK